jgi:uncharacterized protein YegJ (DUF2314 family)
MGRMHRIFLTVLAIVAGAAHAQSPLDRAAKDELVFMRDQEPAMQKAFARAAETLDEFLQKSKQASANHTSFALKVAVSQGADTEYFWVNSFVDKGDGAFEGNIGNEPRMVKTVQFGQRYAFPRSHIVDWTYIDKEQRRMVGNFTLCALLTKESKRDADAMKQRFKLDCDWLQ